MRNALSSSPLIGMSALSCTGILYSSHRVFFASLTSRKDQTESWVVLETVHAFSSIVCESVRNNHINIALSTSALTMVLKYTSVCVFCAMRLTKRDGDPVFRFEFNFIDTGNCLVFHDIPVEVLRQECAWSEPLLPDPSVHLILNQSCRRLPTLIEKLRHMGITEMSVDITTAGSCADIALVAESESSRATLHIKGNNILGSPDEIESVPPRTQITVTLSGFAFILAKLTMDNNRCMLMACESKYLSIWIQLPQQYGIVAAVTPAVLVD